MGKTVLIIAYPFPPFGGVATLRTTKFVQYLPEYGWDVIVLTVKNPVTSYLDETLLNDIPKNIPIYRTKALQPTAFYFARKRTNQRGSSNTTLSLGMTSQIKKLIRIIGRNIIRSVMIPDDRVGWVPFALREARKIIKNHRIDVIYTTAGPFSTNIIGSRLAQKTGIPWVADFRDPFLDRHLLNTPYSLRTRFYRRMERQWIERSACVISVTSPMTLIFRDRYPEIPEDRWLTITNGYSEDDFRDKQISIPSNQFTLRYIGSLYSEGTADDLTPFLKAIYAFLQEVPEARTNFRMIFTGAIDNTFLKQLHTAITTYNLADNVILEPPVSHDNAIELMCSSTALLITLSTIHTNMHVALSVKAFEYLRTQKPILGLLPQHSAIYELLSNINNAYLFNENDTVGITRQLKHLYEQWRSNTLLETTDFDYMQYERKALTGKLAKVLDEVCESNGN